MKYLKTKVPLNRNKGGKKKVKIKHKQYLIGNLAMRLASVSAITNVSSENIVITNVLTPFLRIHHPTKVDAKTFFFS